MRHCLLAAVLCAVGCEYNPLFPDPRSATDRARAFEAHCKASSEAADALALSPTAIEAVAPAYSHVASGSERAPRLRGAQMWIRPDPALSSDVLQRSLQCHQVRVSLGEVAAPADDPYSLPGSWLLIHAESTDDGLVVTVMVDRDTEKAREVLGRARRFAAARP